MAKAPLVNGRTARQIAVVIDNCIKRDACNSCPYDKKQERGKSCVDFLLSDASLALRRLQKRYEKQRERYYIDREEIERKLMARTLWVAYFSDPEYREIHMLGVFQDREKAEAYIEEKKEDAKRAKAGNLIFGIGRTSDK